MNNIKEQNQIHIRLATQIDNTLSQSEIKQELMALFALLLEMQIDQTNDVTKELAYAKQSNRCPDNSNKA